MIVNAKLIVLDVETGGFSPSQNLLTQIGGIIVDSFNFEEISRFNYYIKPYDDNLYINKSASELTGITLEKCEKEGKTLKEVLDKLCSLFKQAKVSYYLPIILGHNISFDLMFIEDVFDRVYGKNSGKNNQNKLYDYILKSSMDTMVLARQKFVNNEVSNFKLETISEYLGYINHHAHDAFADVECTLFLAKYFITSMRGGNSDNIKQELIEKENSKSNFNYQF